MYFQIFNAVRNSWSSRLLLHVLPTILVITNYLHSWSDDG